MDARLKRRLAIGGAALATFGVAGGAYAVASNNGNGRDAYLNDVANRLHVSRQQLDSALKGAFEDRLAQAVKDGKLTQAEADAIKQKVEQGGGAPMLGLGPGPGMGKGFAAPGPFFGARPFMAGFQAAAKYLGLTNAQLKQQLVSGKSLAQIAGDQKKSVDGLKTAIRDAVKGRLDSLVSSKKITQAQENNILSRLDSRLNDLVNATPPKMGPAFKRGFRHAGGPPVGGPHPGGFFF